MTEQDHNQTGQDRPVGELDRVLDAALAKYAAVEPRDGLEARILANLRTEQAESLRRVWWKWALVAATAAIGLDVAATNADGTDDVAMPTAVVVDADGIIRWIDVHPDYAVRTEPQAILDALRQVLN